MLKLPRDVVVAWPSLFYGSGLRILSRCSDDSLPVKTTILYRMSIFIQLMMSFYNTQLDTYIQSIKQLSPSDIFSWRNCACGVFNEIASEYLLDNNLTFHENLTPMLSYVGWWIPDNLMEQNFMKLSSPNFYRRTKTSSVILGAVLFSLRIKQLGSCRTTFG